MPVPMTKRGADALKQELQRLKTQERQSVIAAIAEARSHGDLSENAEYEAAKNRQSFIEGRINELEEKMSGAQIIDPSQIDGEGRVTFGSTVEIEDEHSGERFQYQIVGEDEADIKACLISVSSPLARALIGKSEGDEAVFEAPGGTQRFELIAVRYV